MLLRRFPRTSVSISIDSPNTSSNLGVAPDSGGSILQHSDLYDFNTYCYDYWAALYGHKSVSAYAALPEILRTKQTWPALKTTNTPSRKLTGSASTLSRTTSASTYGRTRKCPSSWRTSATRSLEALTEVGQNTFISRINAKLQAFPEWNAASIEERHVVLIALAQEVWKTAAIDV